jgi:prolipoprotein diacylglyceryltransferase
LRAGHPTGKILPMYLAGYCAFRFIADFWRRSSVRPRIAGLSEAQVVSCGVLLACSILAFLTSAGAR